MSLFPEYKEETRFVYWGIAMVIVILTVFGAYRLLMKPFAIIDKATNPTTAIASYEEFHNLYNSCLEICDQINTVSEIKTEAVGFSNEERIAALKNKLSNLVHDYNSKSSMATREWLKDKELPEKLDFKQICK